MMKALKVVVLAVAGYAVYELIDGYLRHRKSSGGPAGRGAIPVHKPIHEEHATLSHMPPQRMGTLGGASITGGGQGVRADVQYQGTDEGGFDDATRVGRGVVRRG